MVRKGDNFFILKNPCWVFSVCLHTSSSINDIMLLSNFGKLPFSDFLFINISGPGGTPRPIELHSHDPLRYVGDMLAWLHQAVASEKEHLQSLLKKCGCELFPFP